MKKIKAFLYVYKNSLLNPAYYSDAVVTKKSFAFKYFAMLALIATLAVTLRTVIPMLSDIRNDVNSSLDKLGGLYPDELVIKVENSKWAVNQPEPVIFPFPDELIPEETDFPKNLAVFDRKGTINSMRNTDTLMMINENNILLLQSNDEINVYPLQGLPDGEFDRGDFDSFMGNLRKLASLAPLFIVISVLVGSAFYYFTFRLVSVSIVSLILMMAGRIGKYPYSLGQYFRVAVHSFTLPLTIEVLLNLAGASLFVPFWFFTLNVLFGIYALVKISKPSAENELKAGL